MKKNIVVILERSKRNEKMDLEIPLDITVNELLYGLNEGLHLGINLEDASQCYITSENPIALLKGNRTILECGLHDGSIICINH